MCTLTLFKLPNGFRVFMNRDERHDRAPELPPRIIQSKNKIFGPIDPLSSGTWMAKNEQGYWGCLLNGYFEKENNLNSKETYQSRGEILPHILSQDCPLQAAALLDPKKYLSFRLLIGSADSYVLHEWTGETYRKIDFHAHYENRIHLLCSSSWKQEQVTETRKAVFKRWAEANPTIPEEIPSFHFSTEPDLESAVLMMRSYSGTKSITWLDVSNENLAMYYKNVEDRFVNQKRQQEQA